MCYSKDLRNIVMFKQLTMYAELYHGSAPRSIASLMQLLDRCLQDTLQRALATVMLELGATRPSGARFLAWLLHADAQVML
jgi:hypothetical protein